VTFLLLLNNLLLASASKLDINKIKNSLKKRFKILDLGAYYFYLRIEVIHDYPRRIL
jgi:hypothetical protein